LDVSEAHFVEKERTKIVEKFLAAEFYSIMNERQTSNGIMHDGDSPSLKKHPHVSFILVVFSPPRHHVKCKTAKQ
jgi:hypothetical protein